MKTSPTFSVGGRPIWPAKHWGWGVIALVYLLIVTAFPLPADAVIFEGIDYKITVADSGMIAVMEIDSGSLDLWNKGSPTHTDAQLITYRVYQHFLDVFDFIFLISNQEAVPRGGYSGVYFPVKNDIKGLGFALFDNTASYTSRGKLQGVVHLKSLDGLRGGPSLHELCHRWANGLKAINSDSHWGFSSVGGQLGGWKDETLVDLGADFYQADGPQGLGFGFGVNANGGNSIPYARLELYLMGLIGPEAVPTIRKAIGASFVGPESGRFTANRIAQITMPEIIGANGERVPGVATSQKSFRALVVVLSGVPVSPGTLNALEEDAKSFELRGDNNDVAYNFWEATGGRATIQLGQLQTALKAPPIFLGTAIDANRVTLRWKTIPGLRYRVEYSDGLDLNGESRFHEILRTIDEEIQTGQEGTFAIMEFSDPLTSSVGQRFYRIRIVE